jgi:type II secretory pathway pseudopilin PulG
MLTPSTNISTSRRQRFIFPRKRKLRRRQSWAGFSLLELMAVVGIVMIVAAIAILNVQKLTRSVRLYGAGTDYSNLLQNARVRAVKDDKYYTVLTDTVANPPIAFVDINGNGTYDSALHEPMMPFRSNTAPTPFASGPSVANLKMQFLPPTPSGQASVAAGGGPPTFGPRGLPCTPIAGAGGTTCPYLTPPNFTPTSFITFIQGPNGGWGAVTVTPAGRIRQWAYDGAGNWTALN